MADDIYIDHSIIECGFFNAREITAGEYDRTYFADDFCKPYHRIVSDGIFPTVMGGTTPQQADFKVISANESNRTIIIRAGEGIFDGKWFRLKEPHSLQLSANSIGSTGTRIDSIFIQINNTSTGDHAREGNIVYRQGTPDAFNPQPPAIIDSGNIKEYRLADIEVGINVSVITNDKITDKRGLAHPEGTPFVASLIQTLNTQELFTQWYQLFTSYFNATKQRVDDFVTQLTEDLTVTANFQVRQQPFTTTGITASMPIDPTKIPSFDPSSDVLLVIVNGFMLTDTVDYYILASTSSVASYSVTFTHNLASGTKGVFLCIKAVTAANTTALIEEVNALDDKVDEFIGGNGWQNLSIESGGGTVARTLQYRRIGEQIYVRGVVTGIVSSGTTIVILPIGARPDQKVYVTRKFSGENGPVANFTIDTDGSLTISSVSANPQSSMQFAIDCSFIRA